MKIYLAAISVCHEGINGAAASMHLLAIQFLVYVVSMARYKINAAIMGPDSSSGGYL